MPDDRRKTWLVWALLVACALLLRPMLPAVMLALWLGAAARGIQRPLVRLFHGRIRVASAVSVAALTAILIPFILLLTSLVADAYALVVELLQSERGKAVLEQLAAPKSSGAPVPGSSVWSVLISQQERAWGIIQQVAGTATRVVIALFVVLMGTYAVLVEGSRWYGWFEAHGPIPPRMLGRLRDAFFETGRGLFVGIGGSGLLQAICATIAYVVLGVPHALELGVLTFAFSIIPAIGTALVWGPVAAGLALTGREGAAITLVVLGLGVIGTIDNLARPFLARWGKLQLPTFIVLVAMFAGVQVIGGWGLLVAPLAVRLAKAALESSHDEPIE